MLFCLVLSYDLVFFSFFLNIAVPILAGIFERCFDGVGQRALVVLLIIAASILAVIFVGCFEWVGQGVLVGLLIIGPCAAWC